MGYLLKCSNVNASLAFIVLLITNRKNEEGRQLQQMMKGRLNLYTLN